MTKDRRNAIWLGVFYISAAATSIIAVILYQPILSEQWYATTVNGLETKVLLGVLNDLLLVTSMVGTAVMLFPYLRNWNEHLALGYLCFRFMEAVFIMIGLVGILGLIQLSSYYGTGGITADDSFIALGIGLQGFHSWTFILGPNFMLGLNTALYSYILFRTGLVPKQLALFGMVTAVMVFTGGLLEMFGVVGTWSTAKALIALPVGVYEMSLAAWLIGKGFHPQKLDALRTGKQPVAKSAAG